MTLACVCGTDDRGQDLVEYVLLGATVALAGLAAMQAFPGIASAVYAQLGHRAAEPLVPRTRRQLMSNHDRTGNRHPHRCRRLRVRRPNAADPEPLTFSAALAGLLYHAATSGGSGACNWPRPGGSSGSCCCCPTLRSAAWAAATSSWWPRSARGSVPGRHSGWRCMPASPAASRSDRRAHPWICPPGARQSLGR